MSFAARCAVLLTQSQTRSSISAVAFGMPETALLRALARSFLAGEPGLEATVVPARRAVRRPGRWLEPLARRFVEAFAGQTRPLRRDVIRFLLHDPDFQRVALKLSVRRWLTEPDRMQPSAAATRKSIRN